MDFFETISFLVATAAFLIAIASTLVTFAAGFGIIIGLVIGLGKKDWKFLKYSSLTFVVSLILMVISFWLMDIVTDTF